MSLFEEMGCGFPGYYYDYGNESDDFDEREGYETPEPPEDFDDDLYIDYEHEFPEGVVDDYDPIDQIPRELWYVADGLPVRITDRSKRMARNSWRTKRRREDPDRWDAEQCEDLRKRGHRRGADSDLRKQWRRQSDRFEKLDFQQWSGRETDGFHDWDDGFEQADNGFNGARTDQVNPEDLMYMLTFGLVTPEQVRRDYGVPMVDNELGVEHW